MMYDDIALGLAEIKTALDTAIEALTAARERVRSLTPDNTESAELWDIARGLPNEIHVKATVEGVAQELEDEEERQREEEEEYDDYVDDDDFPMYLEYDDWKEDFHYSGDLP